MIKIKKKKKKKKNKIKQKKEENIRSKNESLAVLDWNVLNLCPFMIALCHALSG